MTTTGGFDASRASGALLVEHCDIPAEMTLCEWRRCGGRLGGVGEPGVVPAATAAPASRDERPRRGHARGARGLGLRRALRLA